MCRESAPVAREDLSEPADCTRDRIVIGASAGGLAVLRRLLAGLPGDLPAAVLIVLHRGPASDEGLGETLGRAGPLPVRCVGAELPVQPGRAYLAPAGRHMMVARDRVFPVSGPRESRARPAIDVLFRSAAVAYSSRVVGVLLSGQLHDGTAGLEAIKLCGGLAVVQAPGEAEFPQMVESALAVVDADVVTGISEMPDVLSRLARQAAPPSPPLPQRVVLEARAAERRMSRS